MLPPRPARLVRQLRDQDEPRWTLGRLGTPAPWLFPGQSPARPTVDILLGVRLHRYGIGAHAGRNTARLVLAAELPASMLADLTGISISTPSPARSVLAYAGSAAAIRDPAALRSRRQAHQSAAERRSAAGHS